MLRASIITFFGSVAAMYTFPEDPRVPKIFGAILATIILTWFSEMMLRSIYNAIFGGPHWIDRLHKWIDPNNFNASQRRLEARTMREEALNLIWTMPERLIYTGLKGGIWVGALISVIGSVLTGRYSAGVVVFLIFAGIAILSFCAVAAGLYLKAMRNKYSGRYAAEYEETEYGTGRNRYTIVRRREPVTA